jgi:adenylyltransferase/sulfurtransferase
MQVAELTVQELQELKKSNAKFFLLDVRNPNEYALCNLGGHLIPLNELPLRLAEIDAEDQVIVHCHAGGRSKRAAEFLMTNGFTRVFNLRGGITAWANEIDPSMPTY